MKNDRFLGTPVGGSPVGAGSWTGSFPDYQLGFYDVFCVGH